MPDRFRVGIVGAGFAQQIHVPAFRSDSRAEVIALAASSPERAAAKAARVSVPRACRDWHELVSAPDLDVVAIAVPPSLQPEIAEAAAREGKHLLCEKPIAADLPRAQLMCDRIGATSVRHAVDFIFAEVDAFRVAREWLQSGEAGSIEHVSVTWHVGTRAYRGGQTSWKTDPAAGGGVLHSFGSHVLYYLEWLLGPVSSVQAHLSGNHESGLAAILQFSSGCMATLSIVCDAVHGSGHRIELLGSRGSALLVNATADYAGGFALTLRNDSGMSRSFEPQAADGVDGRLAATARIVKRLLDSIEEGSPATPNLADGLRVATLSAAIRNAAAQSSLIRIGEPVRA